MKSFKAFFSESANKEVELEEAEKPTYQYYVTHNRGNQKDDWTVTHPKKKPFATARDAADHIMRSGGRQGGTVHTVNAKTGNIVQARSYDSGQAGYARDPGIGDPRHVRDLREEVEQIDELSPNTLHSYIKKAAGNMAGNAAVAAAQASSSSMKKSSPDVKRNIVNRMKGITGASGRLADKANMAEEVEQIDEISKSTLGSYATKALNRADIAARMSKSDSDEMGKIADKRTAGVKKAVDRLAGKKTAASIKSNIDKAREAARNRGTDKDDQGKAYYAAQKGISKVREEVELDEISTELKKRYVEKGAEDVVDRFTGRGKYEKPRNPAHFTKTGRVKKSALNRPEAIKYREKLDNRRDIVNKVSQEVHGKKRFGEEVELEENFKEGDKVSFTTDYGTKQKGVITNPHTRTVKGKRHAEVRVGISPNTWSRVHVPHHRLEKVSEEVEQIDEISKDTLHSYWKKAAVARAPLDAKARKADTQKTNRIRSGKPLTGYKPKDELTPDEKRVRTNRSKGMNRAARTLFRSEEVEINEASDLRITKIYNKWPKKATYAVHTPDRKYFKEFDSEDAAKKHLESKKS